MWATKVACDAPVGCKTSPAFNSPPVEAFTKGLVEVLQRPKAGRPDMFTAVLDKPFQNEFHHISSQSLHFVLDRYGGRVGGGGTV